MKKGFTVLELLIVIAIIIILATVLTPILTKQIKRAKDARTVVIANALRSEIEIATVNLGGYAPSGSSSALTYSSSPTNPVQTNLTAMVNGGQIYTSDDATNPYKQSVAVSTALSTKLRAMILSISGATLQIKAGTPTSVTATYSVANNVGRLALLATGNNGQNTLGQNWSGSSATQSEDNTITSVTAPSGTISEGGDLVITSATMSLQANLSSELATNETITWQFSDQNMAFSKNSNMMPMTNEVVLTSDTPVYTYKSTDSSGTITVTLKKDGSAISTLTFNYTVERDPTMISSLTTPSSTVYPSSTASLEVGTHQLTINFSNPPGGKASGETVYWTSSDTNILNFNGNSTTTGDSVEATISGTMGSQSTLTVTVKNGEEIITSTSFTIDVMV